MPKILVLSDTHRNLKILENVLSANLDCDIIIHLGNDYEDMDNFPNLTEVKEIIKTFLFHLYFQFWLLLQFDKYQSPIQFFQSSDNMQSQKGCRICHLLQ